MSRQRKIIREKLVVLLKMARTKAGNNVTFQSALPVEMKNLPAINLYIENEQVELYSSSPREYKRVAKLRVDILSARKTEAELIDELDDIAAEVEEIFGGFAFSKLNFQGVDPITNEDCFFLSDIQPTDVNYDIDNGGEKPGGAISISFDLEYFEQVPKLGSPLDRFLTATLDWRQDDVAADDGPNDTVAIPQ